MRLPALLETDQIHCYGADGRPVACNGSGQDASRSKRLSSNGRRFKTNGPTVMDILTGAVWTRDANPAEFPLSWDEAQAYVADWRTSRMHGRDNWQLPSRRLLFSLLSHQTINPALPKDHPFENVFTGYYWTADPCSRLNDQAWIVHLGGGRMPKGMMHASYLVWPVAAPESARKSTNRFHKGDGGIYDNATGLIWYENADAGKGPMRWPDALSSIAALNQATGRDWRLPNIRELESLVDLKAHSPALASGHPFVNVRDAYWSSTTSIYEPSYAWTLYLKDGMVGVGYKSGNDFNLWPVRGPSKKG